MGRGADVDDATGVLRRFMREAGGCAVVDGGLATELEAHGADLQDKLWSARCLVSVPHLIRMVHLDYLDAGANVITSASYQATIQGFQARVLSCERSKALLRRSIHITQETRAIFAEVWSKGPYTNHRSSLRHRPVLLPPPPAATTPITNTG